MLQCAYLLYLSFFLECFERLSLPVNHFSSTSALASRGQVKIVLGMVSWVAMITTVFFICDYGPRHGPQAQYKRWVHITGLYDPTIVILTKPRVILYRESNIMVHV